MKSFYLIIIIFFFLFLFNTNIVLGYSNVGLGKLWITNDLNPYGWTGLTDGGIANNCYEEAKGWDGSSSSYYIPAGAGSSVKINPAYHNNRRYFRYKIFLYSDQARVESPRVDDVIINWSP